MYSPLSCYHTCMRPESHVEQSARQSHTGRRDRLHTSDAWSETSHQCASTWRGPIHGVAWTSDTAPVGKVSAVCLHLHPPQRARKADPTTGLATLVLAASDVEINKKKHVMGPSIGHLLASQHPARAPTPREHPSAAKHSAWLTSSRPSVSRCSRLLFSLFLAAR
jgi:hypothetical protein